MNLFIYYLWILLFAAIIWYFLLSRYGLYASMRRRTRFELISALLNVHVLGGGVLGGIIFIIEPGKFSRGLFLAFLGFSLILMTLERLAGREILGYFRTLGYNYRNLLIVGSQDKALEFCELLEEHADWGLKVLGFVQVRHDPVVMELKGNPVLGRVEDLVEICKSHPVDEVVFCPPKDFVIDAEIHLKDLEELGITTRMVLNFYDISHARTELDLFHDQIPILTFHSKSIDVQQLFFKRVLDILGSLVGLVATLLLFPLIALAIKKDSPGPIFFSQARVGVSGRTFTCWKFRTMYVDAEERKKDLLARNEMNGAIFKIREDPRDYPGWAVPAPHKPRRTSPVLERSSRRNESGGDPPPYAGGGFPIPELAPPQDHHQAGDHRQVAGKRAEPDREFRRDRSA